MLKCPQWRQATECRLHVPASLAPRVHVVQIGPAALVGDIVQGLGPGPQKVGNVLSAGRISRLQDVLYNEQTDENTPSPFPGEALRHLLESITLNK